MMYVYVCLVLFECVCVVVLAVRIRIGVVVGGLVSGPMIVCVCMYMRTHVHR